LIELRRDVNDLKKVVFGLLDGNAEMPANSIPVNNSQAMVMPQDNNLLVSGNEYKNQSETPVILNTTPIDEDEPEFVDAETFHHDSTDDLSLEVQELEMIKKALSKNKGRRKKAAQDLGISERTLYRKIKQYELD
jgi:transcriptional regulator with PAS, ATPase and Fis domain